MAWRKNELTSIMFVIALLIFTTATLAANRPDPGHHAGEVGGGSFNESFGDFYFPVGLKVGVGILSATSTLTINSTGSGGLWIEASDSGANATLYFRQNAEAMDAGIKWTQAGGVSRFGFFLDDNSAAGVDSNEYMTIDEDGNVGIGTTNPNATLHVAGNINVTTGNDICIDNGEGCASDTDPYPGNCSINQVRVENTCKTIPYCNDDTDTLFYDQDGETFSCGLDAANPGTMSWWDLYGDGATHQQIAHSNNVAFLGADAGAGINTDVSTISGSSYKMTITNTGDLTPDTIADDGTITLSTESVEAETTGPYAGSDVADGPGPANDLTCTNCVSMGTETDDNYCASTSCADSDSDPFNEIQDRWYTIYAGGATSDTPTDEETLTLDGAGTVSVSISGNTVDVTGTAHNTDTNASTACSASGTNYYLDGAHNCDNLALYLNAGGDTLNSMSSDMNFDSNTLFIDISANKVGVGTSTPNSQLSVGGSGSTAYGIYATGSNYGIYAVGAYQGARCDGNSFTRGVHGDGGTTGYGVYGFSLGPGAGGSCNYDFSCGACNYNYGPFTGAHEVMLSDDFPEDPARGMIVSVTGEVKTRKDSAGNVSISATLPTVKLASKANDPAVLGALVFEAEWPKDHWFEHDADTRYASVNAIGEGRLLVSNVTGPVYTSEYLTTSDIPGYAQRQDDELIHSYTLAKTLEGVDWSTVNDTIEYEGKTYKTYLVAVTYLSG
jgi:hypothetical protein